MQRRLRVSNSWLENTRGDPAEAEGSPRLLAWNLERDFPTGQKTWAATGAPRAVRRGPGGWSGPGGVGKPVPPVPRSPDGVPLLFYAPRLAFSPHRFPLQRLTRYSVLTRGPFLAALSLWRSSSGQLNSHPLHRCPASDVPPEGSVPAAPGESHLTLSQHLTDPVPVVCPFPPPAPPRPLHRWPTWCRAGPSASTPCAPSTAASPAPGTRPGGGRARGLGAPGEGGRATRRDLARPEFL